MITATSVLFAGLVSPGLATTPMLVNVPVLVVVVAFTVIPERVTPDAIVALVIQENEFAGRFVVHIHGATFGTERSITPAGRVSVTVVSPVAVTGLSFFTWSTYVNPVLVAILTAVAALCASAPLTNFLIERSNEDAAAVNVAAQRPPTADPPHDQLYVVRAPTVTPVNQPTICTHGQRPGLATVSGAT